MARLARARQQEERLLAEHEHRRLLQKMRGHNGRAGRERPRALGEGRDTGAGFGHARVPPSSQGGRQAPSAVVSRRIDCAILAAWANRAFTPVLRRAMARTILPTRNKPCAARLGPPSYGAFESSTVIGWAEDCGRVPAAARGAMRSAARCRGRHERELASNELCSSLHHLISG